MVTHLDKLPVCTSIIVTGAWPVVMLCLSLARAVFVLIEFARDASSYGCLSGCREKTISRFSLCGRSTRPPHE